MCLLARLVNQVRKDCGNNNLSLTDIIGPKMFNQVVKAPRKVGDTGPGKQVTNKSTPSIAMKLGHELKPASTIFYNLAIRMTNTVQKELLQGCAHDFQHLHCR